MAHSASKKVERRSRKEIDRNYFFGDVFVRTGFAGMLVLAAIALLTPFSWEDALRDGMYTYLVIMAAFAAASLGAILYGRHLRHEATHWAFEEPEPQ